jgi:hypothetical protein
MLKTPPRRYPSCLDNNFKYTPASHTDLAKTFARIKREQLKEKTPAPVANVRALLTRKDG